MSDYKMKNEIAISITFVLIIFSFFLPIFIHLNQVFAAGKFSIDVKINLKKLTHNDKLKVVASANGENETKYLTGNDLDSNTANRFI